MLVLSHRADERIQIGADITVTVGADRRWRRATQVSKRPATSRSCGARVQVRRKRPAERTPSGRKSGTSDSPFRSL